MSTLLPYASLKNRKLHLGVCGSVAAYKAVELMRTLQKCGVLVNVTLTKAAMEFITPLTFTALGAHVVYTDMFGQDDGLLFGHLAPGQTADAFMIAPATAATLARIAHGMADEMLAAQALAFPTKLILAPAMNPHMWNNPATQDNIALLQSRGHMLVAPESGTVACGDTGQGKLADVEELALAAARGLVQQDMSGKNVLITMGPTQEKWDGVRVWTNLSTGRMGAALAQAAWLRGATVYAIAGPGTPTLPHGVIRHNVTSAEEMFSVAKNLWEQSDIGIFTAAVADFRPEPFGSAKFKKSDATDDLSIRLLPNPDILATLAKTALPHQRILGFAAETDCLEERAKDKLLRKKCHMVAGNQIGVAGSGFAADTNTMFVCDTHGREEHWPQMSKADVAWRLLDWLLPL